MSYDALLLGAVLFAATAAFVAFAHDALSPSVKPFFQSYLLLVCAGYFAWFWTHGGQTLAMKTWRLRVVSRDGSDLAAGRALLRFAAAIPALGLAGIGVLWALFDRDRQFLHDRLAGTRLVMAGAA